MAQYTININNKTQTIEADEDTPLLWVIRDHFNLVGTKYGCGIGQCGACTIHLGDHPVQKAWKEHDVPQCGYCQSGQMMSASALLSKNPNPSDDEIQEAMNGNICRCGTYLRINKAVKTASKL
jgi:isoquinoline 1-oxidoreductase alpha subunit